MKNGVTTHRVHADYSDIMYLPIQREKVTIFRNPKVIHQKRKVDVCVYVYSKAGELIKYKTSVVTERKRNKRMNFKNHIYGFYRILCSSLRRIIEKKLLP